MDAGVLCVEEGAVVGEPDAFLRDLSPFRFGFVMHSPDHVEVNNNAKYNIHPFCRSDRPTV